MIRFRRILLCSLIALVLCELVYLSHRHTDAWAPRAEITDEVLYLPSGRFLKLATLGYDALVADLLWIRATAMFGAGYGSDDDWQAWLYHTINLCTDLDPKFRAPYKYGGTMLRIDGRLVDQSNLIFQKGSVALPGEWYFPFAIAMNYFMHKDDRLLAARYMEQAARVAREAEKAAEAARARGDLDAPELDPRRKPPAYLANLAASLYSDSDQLEVGLTFLEEELRQLPESPTRDAVKVKILETGYLIALRDATAVIAQFRDQTGAFPEQPGDVASIGLSLPMDPLGGRWDWDGSSAAEPGSLVSSAYVAVFTAIIRDTGLGRIGRGRHGEQGVDDPQH